MITLSEIEFRNGVNEKAEPFLTVVATGQNEKKQPVIMVAQMSPAIAREHAMLILSAAEAAEQDAATFRVFRKLELPDGAAATVIAELRKMRTE